MIRSFHRRLGVMPAMTLLAVAALAMPTASPGEARSERPVFAADESGSPLAREAIELCVVKGQAEKVDAGRFERGLEVAERAVAETPGDAKAHFAIFCNLGRKMERRGASLASIGDVGRLKSSIERALEIEPRFVDALIGKGRLLDELPWLMGGDDDEGERLLREAVSIAPDHAQARISLAEFLLDHDEAEEARRLAVEAEKLAQANGERELLARARTVADEARG